MGARFVRLAIAGFKSFADATSLEILPGLTGIVGPNGCGKSNVAEALRWAMGETNARHLRGGEMDDVIFAGSAARPSRNLAEVSLTLEDDEGGLPAPYAGQAELQLARRIERGGGSAYRVNGREVRARDVQTLLADLASGARSSAMVSQGRVGALVNARPEERRAVLEEAAGITGLHARRAEAETRLRAAETNLERAEERRALLERQLDGLRGQARQAARYRTVMVAVLEAEAALLALARARAHAAQAEAASLQQAAADAVQHATIASVTASADADRLSAAVPSLRDTEAAARTRLERARLDKEVVEAEAARNAAALAAAHDREAQVTRDLTHAEIILHDAEGTDARLVAEAERLLAESASNPAAHEAARAEAHSAAAALALADQAATGSAARAADIAARCAAFQHVLDQAEARTCRANDAHSRLDADRTRSAAQMVESPRLIAADVALVAANTALAEARAAQERAEQLRHRTATASAQARETYSRADTARHKLAAETAALAEVLAVNDGERWPPMVDSLTVPAGLEAALGAALGEELAAAADPGAARHWRPLPAMAVAPVPGLCLAQRVEAPALLSRALTGIGLVKSDAEGDAAQATLQPGQTLVSVTGAVWRWDGYTVRAGARTASAVRLEQRNRLASLRDRLTEAEHEADAARIARETADRGDRGALSAEQQAHADRRDAEAAVDRARSAALTLHNQAENAAARLASLDEQLHRLAPELTAARTALAAATRDRADLPDPSALRSAADAARGAVATARTRDSAAGRALDALQRAEHSRQARLRTIEQQRRDHSMRAADHGSRITDLRARLQEAAAEHARLSAAPARAAHQAQAARDALMAAEETHRDATTARDVGERQASAAATAARTAEHAVFAVRETLVRAEAAQQAAAQAGVEAEVRIAERESALPPFPTPTDLSPQAEDRARTRLHRLTRERDDMGPVNLRAEIEAATIDADIATIVRERDELGTAIAKLRGSIGHLNREGRERLTAVFQQVDRHFQALFSRMFGGGRAHLALVGSDDPLQAGLEIYAQPPGKKLATLSLLSGGEQALTALSLIFAVFRCNPAPLCVLDEVDAPLDDANVERLCSLLSDVALETGTRFLVVTHHQLTMARMDRLYGVTMQERGVSRLLSVDLSHASQMVEAIAAE